MKYLNSFDKLRERMKEGIVTPYFKYNSEMLINEFGYCLIDENNIVKEKFLIDGQYKDILFDSVSSDGENVQVYINTTNDGHFRCWITNLEYYVMWKEDKSDECMRLILKRRK